MRWHLSHRNGTVLAKGLFDLLEEQMTDFLPGDDEPWSRGGGPTPARTGAAMFPVRRGERCQGRFLRLKRAREQAEFLLHHQTAKACDIVGSRQPNWMDGVELR